MLASDIDPVAVEVTRDNARANGVGPLVRAVTADGLTNPILAGGAPYDLLIANILAGPLTQLAPSIIKALAPGAMLVLSGLLRNQEALVTSFYRDLRFIGRRRDGPWSALVLEKPTPAKLSGMDKPFQTYDDTSDPATCAPRLAALRAELAKRGLDGFVVPHSDQHMGEYLPAYAERLAWLTSFTGSAGAAVVLKDKAAVFVDGRYTLQVRNQTDTSQFEPRDLVAEGPQGWIPDNLPKGAKLGYDPWLHTQHGVMHLKAAVDKAGGTLVAVTPIPSMRCGPTSPPRPSARPNRMRTIWPASRARPSGCAWATG